MGFHVLACFRLFTAWEQKLRFSLLWISDSVQIIVRWPKYLGGQLPVNHQLQEVGFLFSHILLPLFCKWIRIWLVSLFTVYLSRAISKHLKSNIGQSLIHTRRRIPWLVSRPASSLSFNQNIFSHLQNSFLLPKPNSKQNSSPSQSKTSYSPSHILHGIPTTSLLPMLHFALFPRKEAANAEKVQSWWVFNVCSRRQKGKNEILTCSET